MSLERIVCQDREDWLRQRFRGIGGSEAAAVCGLSPWQTPIGLWKLKTKAEPPKDLSDNPAVQQGVRMEPALREFFKAMHPEFEVEHHPFDMLYQSERPWLYATLDGEIVKHEKCLGHIGAFEVEIFSPREKRGILEIKTASPSGKAGWSKWSDGNIPSNYLTQLVHQFLATGYDFAFLFAALYSQNGDITLREYELDRADVEADIAWLLDKETEFWRCIQEGTIPSLPITL